ncbi:hypothetical protein N658DRAFT_234631 [Parathielavia hyrcaniae]|uniref:Uncharacterized protein n=1 Tax=Parathielavia hyrcaniae TaxID=113614 RepID=A0AAN6Q5E2_9PEZI|nr:hypothetical protein N658DRAFT_234631 [Parathielavia hyrcaniae]
MVFSQSRELALTATLKSDKYRAAPFPSPLRSNYTNGAPTKTVPLRTAAPPAEQQLRSQHRMLSLLVTLAGESCRQRDRQPGWRQVANGARGWCHRSALGQTHNTK